jgi:hypothetical protein
VTDQGQRRPGAARGGSSGYSSIRVGLRPPRVVIVFDGAAADWQYWARLALHTATGLWGGQGFLPIPHQKGEVDDALLRAAAVYDPDYVLLLKPTIAQYEAARPGQLPVLIDGKSMEGEERRRFLSESAEQPFDDPEGSRARATIAAVCSPHRRQGSQGSGWDEHQTLLPVGGGDGPLTNVGDVLGTPTGPCLAAPRDWSGPLGIAATARCGALDLPALGVEPTLNDEEHVALARWLFAQDRTTLIPASMVKSADGLIPADVMNLPVAWGRTTHGLGELQRGFPRDSRSLIVLGDSAADFALAYAWDRIYGRGFWLPAAYWPSQDTAAARKVSSELRTRMLTRRDGNVVQIVTRSVSEEQMKAVRDALRVSIGADFGIRPEPPDNPVVIEPISFPTSGERFLAVTDQFDQQMALPVHVDDSGGKTLVVPPPAPMVSNSDLARSERLDWQVELEFLPLSMPRRRGLDGHSLVAPDTDPFLTWVRTSRDGITYESRRYDFIVAGTPKESQLARPMLRELSLLEWLQARTRQDGHDVQFSAAGLRVEILRRLWGSRDDLTATMGGPLLPVLRAFRPSAKMTKDSYEPGHGVTIGPDGYLTFLGMQHYAAGLDPSDLRRMVDDLIVKTAVRRGLILDCSDCGNPSFVPLRSLGQTNECPRCGADNEVTQARWRHPQDEPIWHYDLHAAVRELLGQDGDVPLLLASYLRRQHRHYADVAEVELLKSGQRRPAAEADLVAACDDQLITAEVKKSDSLGSTKPEVKSAAGKRVLLAAAMEADQIILGTTQDSWKTTSIEAVRREIKAGTWPAGRIPALRLITSLGSARPSDSRVNIFSGVQEPWKL